MLLLEILITFIFLNIVFFLGLPRVELKSECGGQSIISSNLITQKLILVCVMFVFSYMYQLLSNLSTGIPINNDIMLKRCYEKSLNSLLGYMLYMDYTLRNGFIGKSLSSSNLAISGANLLGTSTDRPEVENVIASLFVVGFDVVILLSKMVVTTGTIDIDQECLRRSAKPVPDTSVKQ